MVREKGVESIRTALSCCRGERLWLFKQKEAALQTRREAVSRLEQKVNSRETALAYFALSLLEAHLHPSFSDASDAALDALMMTILLREALESLSVPATQLPGFELNFLNKTKNISSKLQVKVLKAEHSCSISKGACRHHRLERRISISILLHSSADTVELFRNTYESRPTAEMLDTRGNLHENKRDPKALEAHDTVKLAHAHELRRLLLSRNKFDELKTMKEVKFRRLRELQVELKLCLEKAEFVLLR
jgi:hypothetical protein